jgi:type II secretory pathway component GspD/PulD (secretin)
VIITAVAVAAGQTEPNQVEPNQMEPNQMEPNRVEDNVESILLDQPEVDIIIDTNHLSNAEESFADQPIQSINFRKDMSIRNALRFLATKYRKNIIPSSQVSGNLNITNLYEVTFEEALDAILGHNYWCEVDGNFIRVYTAEEYEKYIQGKARMTSRVFELYYVNAAEIKALITPIMSESGKIASTTAAAVNTEAGEGGDTMSMRDSVVVYDFPERLDEIGKMISQIDIKPQQILIEVTILKATLTETTQFGINWSALTSNITSTVDGISIGFAIPTTTVAADAGLHVGFTNNDRIVSLITALEDVTDTTVLANPKIMAMNKQAGYINIGSETGYTESTTQSSTGTTASVAFLPSGTLLKFRPFICENGYVRMEINPEESTATTTTTSIGTVIPSKTITQVKTNIMVKDGRTIIIGGLFKEDLTSSDSQVPVVGDIPIIGAIFKKTKDANIRNELIILITPHIINDPEELASESEESKNDISRIVDGSRKRISSISRVRIYEDSYAKAVEYYTNKEYDKALAKLNWIIGFRPNVIEAVELKEKILAEIQPDKYRTLERIMLDQVRKEQDVIWKRR